MHIAVNVLGEKNRKDRRRFIKLNEEKEKEWYGKMLVCSLFFLICVFLHGKSGFYIQPEMYNLLLYVLFEQISVRFFVDLPN